MIYRCFLTVTVTHSTSKNIIMDGDAHDIKIIDEESEKESISTNVTSPVITETDSKYTEVGRAAIERTIINARSISRAACHGRWAGRPSHVLAVITGGWSRGMERHLSDTRRPVPRTHMSRPAYGTSPGPRALVSPKPSPVPNT